MLQETTTRLELSAPLRQRPFIEPHLPRFEHHHNPEPQPTTSIRNTLRRPIPDPDVQPTCLHPAYVQSTIPATTSLHPTLCPDHNSNLICMYQIIF